MAITPHGENFGRVLSQMFGGKVRSVDIHFAVDEIVTVTAVRDVELQTAEGIVRALQAQKWVVDEEQTIVKPKEPTNVTDST